MSAEFDDDIMYDSDSCDEGAVGGYDSDDDLDDLQFSGGEEGVGGGASREASKRPRTIYQTLTPDMISKKMFDIIDDVNAVFQLPTPHVRILLTTCKWDKERLLERYNIIRETSTCDEFTLCVYERKRGGGGREREIQMFWCLVSLPY